MREHLIEQDDVGAHLRQLRVLRVVEPLGRGDEQSEHQRDHSRDDTHAEPDDIFGIRIEMVRGQQAAQSNAEQRGSKDAHKSDNRYDERIHDHACAFSVPALKSYERMLTARAATKTTVSSEMSASIVIRTFAHVLNGIVSVGLNAVALVNPT